MSTPPLTPHLKIVELKFGDVLAEAGSQIRQAYFPYSGVISLVVQLKVGSMIETAMVGHDGVVNATPALEKVSLNKGIVQAGLIKYSRGHIRVLDVEELQKDACECYGAVKSHFQRLLSDQLIRKNSILYGT
jgi:hypothetical protein